MSAGLKLTDHPRAQRQIHAAKAYGALAGFAVALWLGRRAGVPLADTLVRAILVGALASTITWGVAVAAWRQLARAELELHRRRIVAQLEARRGDGAG